MLADIGNLIGLLIFAIIAILSAVLKKKQKDEEDNFELPPELKPPRDRETAPRARNWEEELRTLLEDRSPPPPVVRHQPSPTRPAVPPPIIQPYEPAWAETHAEPQHAPAPYYEHAPAEPAVITESDGRYSDAAHLQERVAHHLADVTQHRVGTTSVVRARQSEEIQEIRNMLRTHRGARAAIMASVILGPPRGLEGYPS